jgi:AraC-like DNA-binding protein
MAFREWGSEIGRWTYGAPPPLAFPGATKTYPQPTKPRIHAIVSEIVRAEALRGFRELAGELGGDGDAMLTAAGIDPAALKDPDSYLPYRRVSALVERAAKTLKCPDLGLRMAERTGADMLGPLAVAMYNAPTVRVATAIAQHYFHFHNPSVLLAIVPHDGGHDLISLDLRMRRPPRCPQTYERGVATIHRFLTAVSSAAYAPKEICFTHAALSPMPVYRAVFGIAPSFSAPLSGVAVTRALLDAPLLGGDARLRRMAEHFLEAAAPPEASEALAQRARAIIARLMRSGDCAQADLARALGMHDRTLQRRLQAENTTFETLRDDVRRERAQAHLAQRGVPPAHIAEMLGYAEPSAFTRACQRWFGLAPRDVRKRLAR